MQNLTVEQLAKLKAIFYHMLHTNTVIKDEIKNKISQALNNIRREQGQQQQPNVDKSG